MFKWFVLASVFGFLGPGASNSAAESARLALREAAKEQQQQQQQAAAGSQQYATYLANLMSSPPNIALKVQPARSLRFSKSQLNSLLIDLRHEIKAQRVSPKCCKRAAEMQKELQAKWLRRKDRGKRSLRLGLLKALPFGFPRKHVEQQQQQQQQQK
ncbi:hypothetical protein, conserved [Eimeria tenella]|uniref:Uncharacterized protein n=1 Tax=Eimeria tenella TaxID=5802 RepID=U6L0X3_EIMTE|nr:hypothetical protein, conserved [Eimeria tenella]CDJ42244.1 hypothetical protein, conserved [Eimeria tenella]|eukprot:XP_013232994.1 hypothetical protein, conserved [Eimeria tenella]